jgi:hypothetical protein
MQRREFLGTTFAAVFAAGMPAPALGEWKVYRMPGGDFVAARGRWEAQAWYFAQFCELHPSELIGEFPIEYFEGQCFQAIDDDPLPRLKLQIAPWIREHLAADPQTPCYLFTAAD